MTQKINDEALIIKEGINALAAFQSKLDDATWQITNTPLAKLRHISLHLSIVNGSLAGLCEKWEHEVEKNTSESSNLKNINVETLQDIIADLFMHALQLSNLIEISPYYALSQRVSRNIKRFAPNSQISLPP